MRSTSATCGFVDARERDVPLVRRPPVAGVAIHLLLRDEFGHAEAHRAAAFARHGAFRAGGEVDDVQILVAHETHEVRARRETRVGFVRFGAGKPANRIRGLARRGRRRTDRRSAGINRWRLSGAKLYSTIPEKAEVRCRSRRASSSADNARSAPASVRESTSCRWRDWRTSNAHRSKRSLSSSRALRYATSLPSGKSSPRAGWARRGPARRTGVRARAFPRARARPARRRALSAASAAPKRGNNHGAPERRAFDRLLHCRSISFREFRDGQQSSLPGRAGRDRDNCTFRRMRSFAEGRRTLPPPRPPRSSIPRARVARSSTTITA